MSSHHIVKDNQEPALIIANGASSELNLLHQLLEWSPFIVVLDHAIERVSKLGIKMDVVLGDFDDINPKDLPIVKDGTIEVVHTPDQSKTDLEKGIEFLIGRGFGMINVVWATGKRADHSFNNIATLAKYPNHPVVIYDDYSRVFHLPKSYSKQYNQGEVISLFPVGEAHQIKTSGLKYNLDNESLILSERTGSSNEVIGDGKIEISYSDGHLILMECHD